MLAGFRSLAVDGIEAATGLVKKNAEVNPDLQAGDRSPSFEIVTGHFEG
jgi:hypothetical protein